MVGTISLESEAMPIFEYKCDACGTQYEKIMRRDGDKPPPCPSCESEQVTRQLSVFAAHAGGASAPAEMPMCPSGGVCPTPGACGLN